MISIALLEETFTYDPETGLMRWKKILGMYCPIGPQAGCVHEGYLQVNFRRKQLKVHRIAWALMTGAWPKNDLDHINGIRTDNRWCNLREATRGQNTQNRGIQKNNTSGFMGVSVHKGKWRAQICVNRKLQHLGYFKTGEEASAAYKKAKLELHPFASELRL